MKTSKIHLIRHGQTNWNRERRIQGRSESTLTSEGRQQAEKLREQLVDVHIDHAYCSSSQRTRETAEILFAGRDVPVDYCDELTEIHLGPWEGSLWDQMMLLHPETAGAFWERPHEFMLEGAESFEQVQERGVQKFLDIVHENPEREVVIVSHGVLIKSILCYLEQRPLARLWEPPHMHNCAHSIVEVTEEAHPRIVQYAGILCS